MGGLKERERTVDKFSLDVSKGKFVGNQFAYMTGDLRVATKKSSRDDKGTPRCFFVVGGWGWYVLLFHFGEFFCSQTALKRKTRYLCTSLFLSDMNEFFLLSFRILCFFSHLKPKPLPLFVGFQKWSFFSENCVVKKPSKMDLCAAGGCTLPCCFQSGLSAELFGECWTLPPVRAMAWKVCDRISQDRSSSGFPRNPKAFFFWWFLDLGFDGWKSRILTDPMIFLGGLKKARFL